MFKFVLSAFVCLAFAVPASAQCCNSCNTCGPQKRLGVVPVERMLPQISLKCSTDCCGNSRRRLAVERVPVTGARLGMVDRTPCGGGLRDIMKGFRDLGGNLRGGCGCGAPAPAPAPCGCSAAPEPAPAPCGCAAAAAPVFDETPVESIVESAPVADCGCNG